MTRRAWWIAAVLACTAAAVGCKKNRSKPPDEGSARPAAVTDAAPPTGNQLAPMTWTIETTAGKTSRLFATLDAGVDTQAQVPQSVWDQIKASKTVVLQWNFAEVKMDMLKRSEGSLSTDLTVDETKKLVGAIGEKFVADLEQVKPSLVARVLSAHDLSAQNPLQAVINQKAQEWGLPTVYLETGVAQEALLDRFLGVTAVRVLIADLDGLKAGNARLLAAYLAGDAAALATMEDLHMPWKTAGLAPGPAMTAMRKATLADRHAAWVKFLSPVIDRGEAFVAVDVLDALGPDGLVEQLGKAGYTVTRR